MGTFGDGTFGSGTFGDPGGLGLAVIVELDVVVRSLEGPVIPAADVTFYDRDTTTEIPVFADVNGNNVVSWPRQTGANGRLDGVYVVNGSYDWVATKGNFTLGPEPYEAISDREFQINSTADQGFAIGRADAALSLAIDYVDGPIGATVKTDNYTLTADDAGTVTEINTDQDTAVIFPAESNVNFPIGSWGEIARIGTGDVSLTGEVGVILRSPQDLLSIADQFGSVTWRKRAPETFILAGDLA